MRLTQRKKSYNMSYIYQGKVYAIVSPITAISVNKLNVVVTDNQGLSKLFKFNNLADSKSFLASLCAA